MKTILAFALVTVATATTLVIKSNQDVASSVSQYGTRCSMSSQYTISNGMPFPYFVTANFPLVNINADSVNSARVVVNPLSCTGGSNLKIQISPYAADYSFNANQVVDESTPSPNPPYGYTCDLAASQSPLSDSIAVTDSCKAGNTVDVTSQLKAAINAGNPNLVLAFASALANNNPSICYSNANYSGVSCGIVANGASSPADSFELTVNIADASPEPTCAACPCGSTSGKRRSGCPVCNVCTTEPPVEATCAPCPCGSLSGRRRSGCPVCNICTTEPPVQQTPEPTCAPCPCGSTTNKRRTGCPVCNTCPTNSPSTAAPTDAPVQQTPAPSTAAPTDAPTTKSPGSNISGQNNAKSGATKVALSGLTIVAALAALL